MIVVADVSLWGFIRWAERRLRLLGIKVVYPPARASDYSIAELARRLGAVVVTTDKRFPYEDKVVLEFPTNKKPKYEKLYTQLMKKLLGGAMSNSQDSRFTPRQPPYSPPRARIKPEGLVVKVHEPRTR